MGVVNITKILTVHFTESVKDILENKIHSGFIHIAPRKRDNKSKMQTFSLFPYCSILILQQELNKTPNSKAHPWWGKFRHRAPLAVSGSRSSISDLKANDMVRENRWKTDRELGLKQLSSSLALYCPQNALLHLLLAWAAASSSHTAIQSDTLTELCTMRNRPSSQLVLQIKAFGDRKETGTPNFLPADLKHGKPVARRLCQELSKAAAAEAIQWPSEPPGSLALAASVTLELCCLIQVFALIKKVP